MTDQNEQKQEQQGQTLNMNAYRMQLQIQSLAQRNAELTAQISLLEANMQIKDQIEKGEIKLEGASAAQKPEEKKPEKAPDANAEDLGNPPTH